MASKGKNIGTVAVAVALIIALGALYVTAQRKSGASAEVPGLLKISTESESAVALKDAEARASAAEARVSALQREVDELKGQVRSSVPLSEMPQEVNRKDWEIALRDIRQAFEKLRDLERNVVAAFVHLDNYIHHEGNILRPPQDRAPDADEQALCSSLAIILFHLEYLDDARKWTCDQLINAVKKFQTDRRLVVDGRVGRVTWTELSNSFLVRNR